MKPKYDLIVTSVLKKDLKILKKRGYDLSLIDNVVTKLQSGEPLDPKYKDHQLKGNKSGFRIAIFLMIGYCFIK